MGGSMRATWLETAQEISVQQMNQEGIQYEKIPASHYQVDLDRIKKNWNYTAQDVVELNPQTPNLETICAKYDKEHLHTDDEVRYILSGQGYFDIRSRDDRWMHIFVEEGDFILVPSNRHHLFYLTHKKHIKAVRLFKENPSWTPIYRSASLLTTSQK